VGRIGVTLHQFFLYSAMAGGALFLVQIGMTLFPRDAKSNQGPASGPRRASADTAYGALSLQSLTVFFAMFGLVGMALRGESQQGPLTSILGGLAVGLASTFVMSRIFNAAREIEESDGPDLNKALGLVGTVYLSIAPEKPGKVTLNLEGRPLTLDATSSSALLDEGTEVKVERVLPDGSLVVSKS